MCCHTVPGLSTTIPTNLTPRPTDFRFPAPVPGKLRRTFVTLGDDEGGDTGEGCRCDRVGHESCTACESTRGAAHLISLGGVLCYGHTSQCRIGPHECRRCVSVELQHFERTHAGPTGPQPLCEPCFLQSDDMPMSPCPFSEPSYASSYRRSRSMKWYCSYSFVRTSIVVPSALAMRAMAETDPDLSPRSISER